MDDPPFLLTKWYLDVADAAGAVAVVYAARLAWRGVKIDYAASLVRGCDGAATSAMSLARGDLPESRAGRLRWVHDALPVEAEFEAMLPAAERELMPGVTWTCAMPLARARVSVGDRLVAGAGYVERLEMTVPPWRMPIDVLRWGRFVGGADAAGGASVVWIRWEGPRPLSITLVDGVEAAGEVTDLAVGGPSEAGGHAGGREWSVRLPRDAVLRDGPLLSVVAGIPGVRRLFPASILQARETKWAGPASLIRGGEAIRGHVLHEVVRLAPQEARVL